jgi:hypothetical protein
MHAILHTVEMPRAEERLMPVELFNAIDTLESMVLHGHASPSGHSSPPQLAEWMSTIAAFGAHYHLDAVRGPIVIDSAIYGETVGRFNNS